MPATVASRRGLCAQALFCNGTQVIAWIAASERRRGWIRASVRYQTLSITYIQFQRSHLHMSFVFETLSGRWSVNLSDFF